MGTKQIGLTSQTILALIPSIITQFIAFFRIKKYKEGILISLGLLGASIYIQTFFTFPYGLIPVIPVTIVIPVYYVRKWTRQFNDNLNYTSKISSTVIQDDLSDINKEQNTRSLKILKERLARGDISKEEYLYLKKEFE
ncbi:MAG: SHOCT domain-containing protein [Nitrosarchaeum sp.]|nr:SHOCT domain-containing protein [Nitrosarchaeum sp.]